MFRCSGSNWEPWGWGAGEAYQYTALLKDSSSSARDPEPDLDEEEDQELTEERWRQPEQPTSRKNKDRKKSHCPLGMKISATKL